MTAAADVASTNPEAPLLPGSYVNLGDAVENADLIVVAAVESSAIEWSGKQGDVHYAASVAVSKILKGAETSTQVSLLYRVPSRPAETPLAETGSYIFFLHLQSLNPPQEGQYHVSKVLAATDKNLSEVPKMIGKPPGSDVEIEDAIKSADLIALGFVDSSGLGESKALGAAVNAVNAHFLGIFKGAEQRSQLSFVVPVRTGMGEVPLAEKARYIFFLNGGRQNEYSFLKVLPATVKNTAEVQKIIGKLPGSGVRLDDAVTSSDLIAVALVDSCERDFYGRQEYKLRIGVKEVLKGAEERKQLSFRTRVDYFAGEIAPEATRSYIFFLKAGSAGQYSCLKALAATDENTAEVTKLIAGN